MNKKILPTTLLIIWSLSVLFYFGNNLVEVSNLYNDKKIILLSRNLSWFFVSCVIVVLLSSGIFAFYTKKIFRIAILGATSAALFYQAFLYSANILNDFRTYSYEILISFFFFWFALILTIFIASMMFDKTYKKLLNFALLVTISSIVVLTLEGRGSVEHINLLIGGLLHESTWEMYKKSSTLSMLYFMIVATIIWSIIYLIANWVKDGKFYFSSIKHNVKMFLVFILFISLTLISIPAGEYLNKLDIKDSEKFIAEIIEKVDVYYSKKGEYPRDLRQLEGVSLEDPPRLLDIFEYLANGYKGAYYFSRPQKFCFVFQNPGKDLGYRSITNERKWRFTSTSSSVEDELFSICDDGGPRSHQNLIAGHLGVSEFSNPLDEMALELNQDVRSRQSKLSTENLEKEINKLGAKDPTIYGDTKPNEHFSGRDIDDLRFSIMTGELEDIEPFSIKQFDGVNEKENLKEEENK